MIRGIGFDLDNTLFDHRGAAAAGMSSLLHKRGWVYEGEPDLETMWQQIEQKYFSEYVAGNLTLAEHRRERMREFLQRANLHADGANLDGLFADYLDEYSNSWTAYSDALPALEALRESGYVLAVLTNGQQEQQERKLAKMGLRHFFTSVLAIGKVTHPKPDARAFLQMCASLECEPEEVVYVGDDPQVDAAAATRAGLYGVWLNREGSETQVGISNQISTLFMLKSSLPN
ncbi:MAG: HAD family hydrolase [Candidatus Nanopelagicaceae bacterium]|nr:HAD family hydrolase [Candidatus Nanopelagicaceae bacterium]